MTVKTIGCVVGARPNFMKLAPILKCLDAREGVNAQVIHTGQHYDAALSDVFFEELGIRRPDVFLGVGSGSHATQTADILIAMEKVLVEAERSGEPYDRLVVVGDVNSTMAATLAAAKLNIPVSHVEAGLRSRDRTMPEEVNRVVTDALADQLLCSEPAGLQNLTQEGHSADSVYLVGNVMIDTLLTQLDRAKAQSILNDLGVQPGQYCVVTLHRPSNVDDPDSLGQLIDVLCRVSQELPIVFPIHPRTLQRMTEFGMADRLAKESGITALGPQGYLDFLCLTSQAKVIVTDSGGLQEESTALGVPCLTMRANTERPITVEIGTSTLIGNDAELLERHLRSVLDGTYKVGECPEFWDGKAAERITDVLLGSA